VRRSRLLLAAGVLAFGATLSGCVAAAIPVIAGGALLRSGTDGEDARVTVENVLETPAPPMLMPAPLAATDPENERVFAGPAPAPDSQSRRDAQGFAAPGYDAFLAFAGSAAPGRLSALLADPTSLSAERKPCAAGPTVALIDLDPAGGVFGSEPVATPRGDLARGLARLRNSGVEIAWISGQSAAHAGAVREALAASGLDPEGADRLLLMRYPGDRKQTRRQDLAASACLVAIAGDARSDFDELYDYLVNPEAALGLELLIGDGWFLVPPLFPSDQRPTP
jgi:hypothetical protein